MWLENICYFHIFNELHYFHYYIKKANLKISCDDPLDYAQI